MKMPEGAKKRRWVVGVLVVFLATLVFILLKKRTAHHRPMLTLTTGRTLESSAPPSKPIDLHASDAATGIVLADSSGMAAEKVRRAFAKLVSAKSHREVLLMAGPDDTIYHYTISYLKPDSGQNLLRCDLVVLDPMTFRPLPGRGTVQLSNEKGNWELHESLGAESAMFRPNKDPLPTLAHDNHKSIGTMAARMPDARYTETISVFEGRPVTIVSQIQTHGIGISYMLDEESGSLISMKVEDPNVLGLIFYEINPPMDQSIFQLSSTDIIAPHQIQQLADALSTKPDGK